MKKAELQNTQVPDGNRHQQETQGLLKDVQGPFLGFLGSRHLLRTDPTSAACHLGLGSICLDSGRGGPPPRAAWDPSHQENLLLPSPLQQHSEGSRGRERYRHMGNGLLGRGQVRDPGRSLLHLGKAAMRRSHPSTPRPVPSHRPSAGK